MVNKWILIQLAIVAILDIWLELFVEWDIMLTLSDLYLCWLPQVHRMGWRLMLHCNNDHQLVYFDDDIPWIGSLSESVGMAWKYFFADQRILQHNLGCFQHSKHNFYNFWDKKNVKDYVAGGKELSESQDKLPTTYTPCILSLTQFVYYYNRLFTIWMVTSATMAYNYLLFDYNRHDVLTLHLLHLLHYGFKSSIAHTQTNSWDRLQRQSILTVFSLVDYSTKFRSN